MICLMSAPDRIRSVKSLLIASAWRSSSYWSLMIARCTASVTSMYRVSRSSAMSGNPRCAAACTMAGGISPNARPSSTTRPAAPASAISAR